MNSKWHENIWNIAFSTLPKSLFGPVKGRKRVPSDWRPLKTSLSWHQSRILGLSRGRKWLKCHLPLESRLYQLEKSRILGWSRSKNYFKVTFDNLNHRFFAFIKLHFQLIQKPKIKLRMPSNPRNFLPRPHPSSSLGWSRGRKWVQSDMRPLETSLFRLYPSRILGWSRGRKWFLSDCDHLKHRLFDITKVEFWACQDSENDFEVRFVTWIVALSTRKKSHFLWSRRKKLLQSNIRQLES